VRLYYLCSTKNNSYTARECHAPTFRADQVDAVVWEWVKSFVANPEALACGLNECQAEREKENTPIRERLGVADDLLADNQRQLERLLDLYLSGQFPKEVLTDRKARLEATLGALERERVSLAAKLEARTLTHNQIRSLQEFVAKVSRGINLAEASFADKLGVIEDLNVWGTLAVEDDQKVVRVSCILGKDVGTLHPASSVVSLAARGARED